MCASSAMNNMKKMFHSGNHNQYHLGMLKTRQELTAYIIIIHVE